MLRICLFGPPKRRKQPERYAKIFCPILFPQHAILGVRIFFYFFFVLYLQKNEAYDIMALGKL
jgi:hypothetical protein